MIVIGAVPQKRTRGSRNQIVFAMDTQMMCSCTRTAKRDPKYKNCTRPATGLPRAGCNLALLERSARSGAPSSASVGHPSRHARLLETRYLRARGGCESRLARGR